MIYELNCPYGLLEARLIRPFQHESHSGTLQVFQFNILGLVVTLASEVLFRKRRDLSNVTSGITPKARREQR